MFRGNHPTRVDEKGRLKVPAEFKRVLDEKYGQQFYITSFDGKVAQVYPFEEWERIEQTLAGLPSFNPTKKKFLDRTNYWGQPVAMGGQSLEIAKRLGAPGHLIGFDKDPKALEIAKTVVGPRSSVVGQVTDWPRVELIHGSFADLAHDARRETHDGFDGILADLG